MQTGMCEDLLLDGVCVAQVLVEAAPERIAECYGTPLPLFKNHVARSTEKPADVSVYVGKPKVSKWCVVEPTGSVIVSGMPEMDEAALLGSDEEFRAMVKSIMENTPDYLEPLFIQAESALGGEVPKVDRTRETPVTTAGMLSEVLRAPAIALWGSDEWPGLAGGW